MGTFRRSGLIRRRWRVRKGIDEVDRVEPAMPSRQEAPPSLVCGEDGRIVRVPRVGDPVERVEPLEQLDDPADVFALVRGVDWLGVERGRVRLREDVADRPVRLVRRLEEDDVLVLLLRGRRESVKLG